MSTQSTWLVWSAVPAKRKALIKAVDAHLFPDDEPFEFKPKDWVNYVPGKGYCVVREREDDFFVIRIGSTAKGYGRATLASIVSTFYDRPLYTEVSADNIQSLRLFGSAGFLPEKLHRGGGAPEPDMYSMRRVVR